MATPTPGKHTGAGVIAATPPVSTPFSGSNPPSHLAAFSPLGPRSVVPSPQQFKKGSPANSNTLYGHPTTSSFGAVNFDSPSTAAALGGLGMAVGDLALDANGGLIITGSGSGTVRADEDEKRKRLGLVLNALKANKGRVSEEGIERLARRVGLECLWEDQMGSGGTIRTLVVAGTGLSLEFDFANNIVKKASVSFPESPEIVTKHSSLVAGILLRDLQLESHESPLTKMLDRFAVNLERLAALDKLSVMPALNCHEAIAGIYESLQRLHEWEVARLKEEEEMKNKPIEQILRTVLCSKSGRPQMNARNDVGLSIDYWQQRHARGKDPASESPEEEGPREPKTWSLVVECAPSPSLVYASVRVTDKWISSDIKKANPTADDLLMETDGPVLDWQEPNNILLPTLEPSKGDNAMEGIEQDLNASNSKYPDVMFIAKFHPPLVVPYAVASQIYSSTGATLDHYHIATVDGLLFPPGPDEKTEADATCRILQREQKIVVKEDGAPRPKKHKNTLTFQKLEYGRTLTELPFSHPRQLVNLLPLFRQYARLTALLDQSFGVHTSTAVTPPTKIITGPSPQTQSSIREEYDDFLAEALSLPLSASNNNTQDDDNDTVANAQTPPPHFDQLPLDVSVHTQPHPLVRLTFPFRRGRTADLGFDVGMNGTVVVIFENVLPDAAARPGADAAADDRASPLLRREDLGRMLELCEDLGVLAEFLRQRLR